MSARSAAATAHASLQACAYIIAVLDSEPAQNLLSERLDRPRQDLADVASVQSSHCMYTDEQCFDTAQK